MVNLNKVTCTCKGRKLSGTPYSHFLAMMREERLNPVTFGHDCYKTKYLRLAYQHTLVPINGEDMWEQAPGVDVKPPIFSTKKKGNLQFKRRLEPGETSTKQFGKVGKSGVKIHCSHCGGEGYYKQTCSQRQHQLKVIPHLNSSAYLFQL